MDWSLPIRIGKRPLQPCILTYFGLGELTATTVMLFFNCSVMKELRNELTRRDLEEARMCGGLDNKNDYLARQEKDYSDKPGHRERSIANDNGQHGRHWEKER
jgi:hypothetical protein